MTEEQKQQLKQQWEGFPEAPYSDTFKWVDEQGWEHMTTLRNYSGTALMEDINKMTRLVSEKGGRPSRAASAPLVTAPAPAMPAIVQQALGEGDAIAAHNLLAAINDVPPAPGGKSWKTMDISRLVIKPEPGDLYTCELYAAGHKWPDLKMNKRKLEIVTALVRPVTSADPSKPLDAAVSATAFYLEGKPKENGGFWLDLYHLRLRA